MNHPKQHLDFRSIAILLVLSASWGLQQITIKVAIDAISPMMQAGIRSIGASVLVFLWCLMRKEKIFTADGTLWWGIAVGILFSVEFFFIYWGLKFTFASRSVIFLYTMPFMTAIGAHIFIPGEQIKMFQVAGLCCAFVGILVAFSESLGLVDANIFVGDIMLLLSALFFATVTITIKASPLSKIKASKTLLYQLAVSALLLPILSLIVGEPGVITLTPLVIACILYQVVWVAFITYLVWFWLINNYPASRLSAFLFFTPLFGVMEGAFLLDETMTPKLLIALIMVCVGIYLVNRKKGVRPMAVAPFKTDKSIMK